MGDRTSVSLQVRKVDYEKYKSIIEGDEECEDHEGFVILAYHDHRGGNLEFECELQENRIPYDKSWDSCAEYPCGTEYCRVLADGSIELKDFNDDDETKVDLADVVAAFESGDIESFLEAQSKERYVMGWESQEAILNAMVSET